MSRTGTSGRDAVPEPRRKVTGSATSARTTIAAAARSPGRAESEKTCIGKPHGLRVARSAAESAIRLRTLEGIRYSSMDVFLAVSITRENDDSSSRHEAHRTR
jgi:hypothetical protein